MEDIDWPGWIQAIGSLAAVWLAFHLWRKDQRQKAAQHLHDENEQTNRLVATLRWEIVAAVKLIETFRPICDEVSKGIAQAKAEKKFQDTPLNPNMFRFTDRVAYGNAIGQIGRLPSEIAELVVRFYTQLTMLEQMLLMIGIQSAGYRRFNTTAPSIEFCGEIAAFSLRRYIELKDDISTSSWISPEEIQKAAEMCGLANERIPKDLRGGLKRAPDVRAFPP